MAGILDQTHPDYDRRDGDWTLSSHAFEGERIVKSKRSAYLPITSGQFALGMGYLPTGDAKPGQLIYDAYLKRAVFPDILRETANALVGVMVREPWNIQLPAKIEYMLERAGSKGEEIEAVVRRILRSLLLYGRHGLLNDIRESTNEIYMVDYPALQIRNWDDTPTAGRTDRLLSMLTLDESRPEREINGYRWTDTEIYRLLELSGDNQDTGKFQVRVERNGVIGDPIQPNLRGKTLDYIPFTFCNATDLDPMPGEVPLLGLARLSMTIYRGEADYRQTLFMQGQETLVLTGVANPNAGASRIDPDSGYVPYAKNETGSQAVIGTGAVMYLPDPNSDAKFIGVEGKGLSEQREALANDYQRAEQFGMALLTSGAQAEASDTIATRVAARTASLAMIVRTAGAALRQQLRWAAEWADADPDEVVVEENIDFIEDTLGQAEINGLWAAKMQGFPISIRTIHNLARKGEITEFTLEEELEEISNEPLLNTDPGVGEPSGPRNNETSVDDDNG